MQYISFSGMIIPRYFCDGCIVTEWGKSIPVFGVVIVNDDAFVQSRRHFRGFTKTPSFSSGKQGDHVWSYDTGYGKAYHFTAHMMIVLDCFSHVRILI